ncbi:formyltetrahydrofolate-dependent phosphoribosylglycinamide formyltransferase [Desulfoluna spongiiphila]|uniref:Phosphoribosylglycinamide formyltransferase n=2 Tax=Desulfoluna spongiiphila TaxID=419481 RepID=A0A1G5IQ27_9BACT|nr:formyltetrahydrofolate-dependent phosphoribosylglycinamide formyltransferase [Desulfoluna spongiiphila]
MKGNSKMKIGVLVSGGGSNLQAIMDAVAVGALDVEIACVGSDNPDAKGLERAEKAGIPTFVTDYSAFFARWKEGAALPEDFSLETVASRQSLMKGSDPDILKAFLEKRALAEAALLAALAPYKIDLLVLAGFMRVLTPYFIDALNTDSNRPRIMNIHPALLPAFPGTDGYGDTFRYGCKVGGCTVHFVDYGEDSGPIIGQSCFPIESSDDLDAVKKKGLAEEWRLFPDCIGLYAEDRLNVVERQGTRVVEILPPAAR